MPVNATLAQVVLLTTGVGVRWLGIMPLPSRPCEFWPQPAGAQRVESGRISWEQGAGSQALGDLRPGSGALDAQ